MVKLDDDFDDLEDNAPKKRIDRRKILVFLIPAVIVIGMAVSAYYAFYSHSPSDNLAYSVATRPAENGEPEQITIFYDLPETSVSLKGDPGKDSLLKLKLNLELSRMEDIPLLEALLPKINDAILAHTVELTPEEVGNTAGLYWLKQELLYRINLITAPVKVSNLNFKTFEIVKNN